MTAIRRLLDLSHPVENGMTPYPGLPGPRIEPHVSHAASRALYAGQAEFEVTRCFLVGNTGTALDSPFHRFPGAADVAALPLERLAGLPTCVVDVDPGGRAIRFPPPADVAGHAVLFRTGWAARWGTPAYWEPAPFLAAGIAGALVAAGVTLVGTDAWNVDDTDDPARPAHTQLLGAGIPVVEHLADLGGLPVQGAWFTAVPAPIRGCASFPGAGIRRAAGWRN